MKPVFEELCHSIREESVPEYVARLLGLALFGIVKGSTDFGPDYFFTSTFRYTFEGDRSLTLAPAPQLLQAAIDKLHINDANLDALAEFPDWGTKTFAEEYFAEMAKVVHFEKVHVGPKSLMLIPGN